MSDGVTSDKLKKILFENIQENSTIIVDYVDKEIVFNSIVNAHLAAVDDNGYVILE